jgi:hypothetical protein
MKAGKIVHLSVSVLKAAIQLTVVICEIPCRMGIRPYLAMHNSIYSYNHDVKISAKPTKTGILPAFPLYIL